MSNLQKNTPSPDIALFDRVVSILDQARDNVVRAVNSNMVMAYWLIGREIVQELQDGEERAEYGKQVLANLSKQLTDKYGKGFSLPNLKRFRQFYQAYSERIKIGSPVGSQLAPAGKLHPAGGELENDPRRGANSSNSYPLGREFEKGHPVGDELLPSFSPQLSWSHYRVLMRGDNEQVRDFYEQESIEGGWSKRTLERQVHTQYYERSLHAQQPDKMIAEGRQLQKTPTAPDEILKNPYVLEFLGYPNFAGVVLYDGEAVASFGEDLYAVPISCLRGET